MLKTIKDLIAKPAPWLYFVLVVALLIMVTNNSGTINDLEAELDNANAEISASDTLTESLSDEIAIRNDAIAGLEADSVEVNARLNQVDSERVALEVQVATLSGQLEDAIANPSCPVVEPCPEAEVCPEPATTETATQ